MSTTPPTEPTPDAPSAQPDAQPTVAYPSPDVQATEAYPPAAPAQPGYPQPSYAAAPAGPDTRPKGVAWTALILAIAGVVLSLGGFIPVPWLGFVAVLIGGLALLAAFIFSIVGLAGKRNGGKPISITALVLSIVGAVIGGFALIVSLVFIGLSVGGSTASDPDPVPSTQASEGTDDGATDDGTTDGTDADDSGTLSEGEAAFISEVRPQVNQIMTQIDPSITPEAVEATLDDETLIMIGQALLTTGQAGIDSFVDQATASAGGAADADTIRSLYQAIYDAAQAHLQ